MASLNFFLTVEINTRFKITLSLPHLFHCRPLPGHNFFFSLKHKSSQFTRARFAGNLELPKVNGY